MTGVSQHRAERQAQHTIDMLTTAGKLADLRRRTEETLHPVGEAAVDKVHAKGKLTARERLLGAGNSNRDDRAQIQQPRQMRASGASV